MDPSIWSDVNKDGFKLLEKQLLQNKVTCNSDNMNPYYIYSDNINCDNIDSDNNN